MTGHADYLDPDLQNPEETPCQFAEFLAGRGRGPCPACGVDQKEHVRACETCGAIITAEEAPNCADSTGHLICDGCACD